MNSIVHPDGTIVEDPADPADRPYDLLNGCTNFGGHAWVAISSNSCSSEATGRSAGMVSLLISHGKNLIDDGLLQPYPGTEQPFSAEEIRQLLRKSAEDIDHSDNLEDLTMLALLQGFLAADGVPFASRRFPTQAGWDQYTGYGRPNAGQLLNVTQTTLPPEADLSGSLRWFDTVDPARTKKFEITGSAARGAHARQVQVAPRRGLRHPAARVPQGQAGQEQGGLQGEGARASGSPRPRRSSAASIRPR